MDCQQLREQIESVALHSSGEELDEKVRQHLNACSNCRAELRDIQEALLLQVAALPAAQVSQELEDRVMQRVILAPEPVREYVPRTVFWKYATAASVLFLLVSATLFRLSLVGNGESKLADGDLAQMRAIATQVAKLNELERIFATPQLRYVSLQTGPKEVVCFFISDPMSDQIHFLCKNLHVTEDSELRLWLLAKDRTVVAKVPIRFDSKSGTGGALIANPHRDEVMYAAITREIVGSDPQTPSDAVVLYSEIDLIN